MTKSRNEAPEGDPDTPGTISSPPSFSWKKNEAVKRKSWRNIVNEDVEQLRGFQRYVHKWEKARLEFIRKTHKKKTIQVFGPEAS